MRCNDFIKNKIVLGRTEATIQSIKDCLNCFWQFYRTKRKKLKTISKKDIEDYLFYLRQKGYKPGTIRDRINGLRDFLRYRNIKTFPAFKKISQPKALPKFLEPNEIEKIRKVIKKERDLLIFDLLYATGMRVGELCSLDDKDINGHSLLIMGKGSKERIVEMPQELYLELKKFVLHNGNGPVFRCKEKRISRSAVSTLVKRYGMKAGLNKRISPHKLRHSFATRLLNRGARIEIISRLLGHSNISTTQIYAQVATNIIRSEYLKYW